MTHSRARHRLSLPKSSPCKTMRPVFMTRGEREARSSKFYPGARGYQSRSFDCELGSHFHRGYVFEGPPIMPDGRISQVRFEVLAARP